MTGHGDSLPPITQLPPHLPLCGRCLFLHHQPPLSQTQSWSSPLIRGPHLQLGASAVLSYHQAQVTVYCNYPPRPPLPPPSPSKPFTPDLSGPFTHTHTTHSTCDTRFLLFYIVSFIAVLWLGLVFFLLAFVSRSVTTFLDFYSILFLLLPLEHHPGCGNESSILKHCFHFESFFFSCSLFQPAYCNTCIVTIKEEMNNFLSSPNPLKALSTCI